MHSPFYSLASLAVAFALLSESLGAQSQLVWESLHQLPLLSPSGDEDGDGNSNESEFFSGTNPHDASDRFSVTKVSLIHEGKILRWVSQAGREYRLETRSDVGAEWETVTSSILGTGGQQEILLPGSASDYRIAPQAQNYAETAAVSALVDYDTDQDGVSDLAEFFTSSNPLDPDSTPIFEQVEGSLLQLIWRAVEGKFYQIQCSPDLSVGSWVDLGSPRAGINGQMEGYIPLFETIGTFFRVSVSDAPGETGVLDHWSERTLNLNPFQIYEAKRYGFNTAEYLEQKDQLQIDTPEPTANVTASQNGIVEIRRTSGVKPLIINYTLSGTAIPGLDYQPLSGTVHFSFGQTVARFEIEPLPSFEGTATKDVQLHFALPDDTEESGYKTVSSVIHVLREARLSVSDFGATGNGVTDDTVAIQASIMALQQSPDKNTLYFPPGTYRLSTISSAPENSGGMYRHLLLSDSSAEGRDLIFRGALGATLFSQPGTLRTHILLTEAKWRSLSFHNLGFEKHSSPLAKVPGEPNSAYGVAVVNSSDMPVEKLSFQSCRFSNCHGAVRTMNTGSNIWGKLKQFSMTHCNVVNLYGSNTIGGGDTAVVIGGGQQVNLTPWVANATYQYNTFVGGPDVVTNFTLNPGGVPKDGSHFGSPLRLFFDHNTVLNMGVEAVFPTSDSRVGQVGQPFVIPSIGEGTVTLTSVPDFSTFHVGQIINFRQWINGENRNCLLTIVAVDPTGKLLDLENLGQSSEPIAGYQININTPMYSQYRIPTEAIITNNRIISYNQVGAMGIASNAKTYIANNFIQNQGIGINFYPEVRDILGTPEKGSVVANNIIVWDQPRKNNAFTYGVQAWGMETTIENNFIQSLDTDRAFGIVSRGPRNHILNNYLSNRHFMDNGYDSGNRRVGIGIGNTSSETYVSGNTTRSWDVGVGPAQAYQAIPYLLDLHKNFNDVLPIDPRGVSTP